MQINKNVINLLSQIETLNYTKPSQNLLNRAPDLNPVAVNEECYVALRIQLVPVVVTEHDLVQKCLKLLAKQIVSVALILYLNYVRCP